MRAVIQKVLQASVVTNEGINAAIEKGLLVLIGIEEGDSQEDIDWLSGKILRLRIFDDAQGVMNLSVEQEKGEILVVSQFTLHASTRKGNRPSYIRAARPEISIPLYQLFIERLKRDSDCPVKEGVFGAYMKVSLVNDGPVTIIIDSKLRE